MGSFYSLLNETIEVGRLGGDQWELNSMPADSSTFTYHLAEHELHYDLVSRLFWFQSLAFAKLGIM